MPDEEDERAYREMERESAFVEEEGRPGAVGRARGAAGGFKAAGRKGQASGSGGAPGDELRQLKALVYESDALETALHMFD